MLIIFGIWRYPWILLRRMDLNVINDMMSINKNKNEINTTSKLQIDSVMKTYLRVNFWIDFQYWHT